MLPEFPNFKKIELSDRADVEKITSQFPPYSDFNFVSMYSWNTKEDMEISEHNGNLIVKFADYSNNQLFYSLLGKNSIAQTTKLLIEYTRKNNMEPVIKLVPDVVANEVHPHFSIKEDRDNFDYIYHIPDLHKSSGKEYEDYRNLLNRFHKKHAHKVDVKYLPIQSAKKDILELDEVWKNNKKESGNNYNDDQFKRESDAIKRIFDFEHQELFATCLFVDGKLVGYSINEALPGEYAICHFAKADTSFSGIYQFLMKKNCEKLLDLNRVHYNYEQDLGMPNLRSAKNSFKPKTFLAKYFVS